MKRDELIKLLTENFKADEEITFLYDDDGYDERGKATGICEDTKIYVKSHYEVLENGKWVRWNNENCHPTRDYEYAKKWGHSTWYGGYSEDESWWKEVIEGENESTVKCVKIS